MTVLSRIWKYRYNRKQAETHDSFAAVGRKQLNHDSFLDFFEKFKKRTRLSETDCVFEVGCGNGLFTELVLKVTGGVIAIDVSENQIEAAKSRIVDDRVEFKVGEYFCAQSSAKLKNVTVFVMLGTSHYFPNKKYMTELLDFLMAECPRLRCVFIGEVCDPSKIFLFEVGRRSNIFSKFGQILLNTFYSRWIYTYFHPRFFGEYASNKGLILQFTPDELSGVDYRYNAILTK